MTPHTVSSVPRRAARMLEAEQACSSLTRYSLSSVVCCALVCSFGTVECWGGRQGGCGLESCVRQLRVCGSQLAVCLVSLFVSVCRSCVSSSSVQRPPIPRWCPVRAWLFFTFLHTYIHNVDCGEIPPSNCHVTAGRLLLSPRWRRSPVPRLPALRWARGGSPSRCRTM